MNEFLGLFTGDGAVQAAPFASETEFQAGSMRVIDLLCGVYSQINHNDAFPYSLRGMEICEEEFQWALYGTHVGREPVTEAADAFSWWQECLALSDDGTIRFCEVRRRLALSAFEQFLALLALAPQMNRKYEKIFAFLQNDVKSRCPTLGLAADLYSLCDGLPEDMLYRSMDRYRPAGAMLFLPWKQEGGESFLSRPLELWKSAAEYLLGVDNKPDWLTELGTYMEQETRPLFHHREEAVRCRQFLDRDMQKPKLLYLYGGAGCGKRFFLLTLLESGGGYVVRFDELAERGARDLQQMLPMLVSYCGLRGFTPVLQLCGGEEGKRLLAQALSFLGLYFPLVCVCAQTAPPADAFSDFAMFAAEISELDAGQQEQLWRYYTEHGELAALRGHESALVSSFRLNPGQITALAAKLSAVCREAADEPAADSMSSASEALLARCRKVIGDDVTKDAQRRLGTLARRVKSSFSRSDLVLPPQQGAVLDFVIEVIRHQYQVHEEFGFGAKLPYGKGISVLLYGPPGTGKTMTAQVLAAQTGLELFRVDSSQIMDKYIGETEKKLGSLFDIAEKTNAILFFDEADAFFAKRTEVGSSNDKYSNAETSYLLQRMESYSGLTVLATNHSNYFDEAFRRRITYSINIPMPDERTRQRIWEGIFPAQLAVDGAVNFAELAEKFPFSGSCIKYVALEAAYAAAIAGTPVTRACIRTGLMLEYARNGRTLGMSEYPAASLLDVTEAYE